MRMLKKSDNKPNALSSQLRNQIGTKPVTFFFRLQHSFFLQWYNRAKYRNKINVVTN